jgi:hypothetical protein
LVKSVKFCGGRLAGIGSPRQTIRDDDTPAVALRPLFLLLLLHPAARCTNHRLDDMFRAKAVTMAALST